MPPPVDAQLHLIENTVTPFVDKALQAVSHLPLEPLLIPFEMSRSDGNLVIEVRIRNSSTSGSPQPRPMNSRQQNDDDADLPVGSSRRNGNGHDFRLRRIHRKLLDKAPAATAEPISAKRLIALAGYPHNSYSLSAVTQLTRARLLVRTADGYTRSCSSVGG